MNLATRQKKNILAKALMAVVRVSGNTPRSPDISYQHMKTGSLFLAPS